MAELVRFPMHDGKGGVVGLAELLALVPDNDWVWSILDFDGIGGVPDGFEFQEFRSAVHASPAGHVMSWNQVRRFAAGVGQFFDLLLVAVEDRGRLSPERLAVDDFGACLLVLEAVDSGAWEVTVGDEAEALAGLAGRLRARYGAEQG
ncbi:hypothetical protein ACFW6S_03180 [Streptomyces sp. NPDC058740]|uniref:hypothetical protein n=1 Tax=unclassified Streptomyces TaxID=2593676 RepID=UPI0036B7F7FF